MDSKTLNVTRGLVRAILSLTDKQRHSPNIQSLCQYVYCKFSINDYENTNETCFVTPAKLSVSDEVQIQENLHNILIAKYISLYIYPIFIFMGIFGNSLSCYIMFLNVRRNGYSANLYLTLLAFVDCLFLLGSALPDWISHIHYKLDIKLLSDLCCRFVYWFGHFTTHLSAGLVVSVTVERFIAIQYPLIAHKINTVKHTHIVLIILITFFFLLDSRVLILVKHFNESIHIVLTCQNDTYIKYERRDIFRCGITNKTNDQTWLFIDFAVYALIPFLIIVTLNSLIIHRLIDAQRLRQSLSYTSKYEHRNTSDKQQTVIETHAPLRRCQSVPSTSSTTGSMRSQKKQRRVRSTIKPSRKSTESSLSILNVKIRPSNPYESSLIRQTANINNIRLTILLLFVSCSFLALTLPAVVINLIMTTKLQTKSTISKDYLLLINENYNSDTVLSYTIARLLMIINHSINFVLYFVVGKRFRRDLKKLWLGFWRRFYRQRY